MTGLRERRRQAGRRLLPRHGPAPRHRGRTARRPADAHPRRAGQRARPRRVLWVRNLLRDLAAEGRTVFLSSHLMSEMALTADHILVIGRGRIIADAPVADIVGPSSGTSVTVRSPHADRLADLLRGPDVTTTRRGDGHLEVQRSHRPGHRRGRGWCRAGASRAGAAPRQPRGLLHVTDRGRRRVPDRAGDGQPPVPAPDVAADTGSLASSQKEKVR